MNNGPSALVLRDFGLEYDEIYARGNPIVETAAELLVHTLTKLHAVFSSLGMGSVSTISCVTRETDHDDIACNRKFEIAREFLEEEISSYRWTGVEAAYDTLVYVILIGLADSYEGTCGRLTREPYTALRELRKIRFLPLAKRQAGKEDIARIADTVDDATKMYVLYSPWLPEARARYVKIAFLTDPAARLAYRVMPSDSAFDVLLRVVSTHVPGAGTAVTKTEDLLRKLTTQEVPEAMPDEKDPLLLDRLLFAANIVLNARTSGSGGDIVRWMFDVPLVSKMSMN